jgi:adenosylcobinamide kinase / adenosylcobinamide-phosphate guanylyltransferase
MGMAIMITGGARSGKSGFAEAYASRIAQRGIYIATSQPFDDEMEARVLLHRKDRESSGFAWETIEEPLLLTERLNALAEQSGLAEGVAGTMIRTTDNDSQNSMPNSGKQDTVILVDCLTLWLTNRMLKLEEEAGGEWNAASDRELERLTDELVQAAAACTVPLLLVTNEVGSGIVPAYPLGRRYRDAAGRLNRKLAEVCQRVFLVTAGIPVDMKALAFRWEEL